MVFEQETTAGGLAAGFRVGDAWLEKFYHHLFRTDTTAIKLIRELGLGDRLEWSHPRTVCLIDGKFQQLDSPLTLLKFSPLRIDERLRVAAVIAVLKLSGSAHYEGKTAEPWLRRWMGKQPYSKVFEPLFEAKFGTMHDQVAQPWSSRYSLPSLVAPPNFRSTYEYWGPPLTYLGNYRPMDAPLFKLSKEEIIQEFMPYLKRINPSFSPGWIRESWLFNAPFAQPIVTTAYREHIPPLRTPLNGLWVANMFQVYPHDRGQNYSFALADQLVSELGQ